MFVYIYIYISEYNMSYDEILYTYILNYNMMSCLYIHILQIITIYGCCRMNGSRCTGPR